MREPIYDLFGEVRVTLDDINAWLLAVPKIQPGTAHAARYVEEWDVPGKIRRAKERGTFEATVSPPRRPSAFWWDRFRWLVKEQSPHGAG